MILIGYSGQGFVAAGILHQINREVTAYCDQHEKEHNPLNLSYLGKESDPRVLNQLETGNFFISIGDNHRRGDVAKYLQSFSKYPATIIHPSAIIDRTAEVSSKGVMVGAGAIINPLAIVGNGAIINTSSVIEHECIVGDFVHIGPGATLCGNVTIGECSFIGAGSVIRQNISIGKNVIIGAGSVIIRDVPDGECVVGNPGRSLSISKKKV